MIRLAIVFGLAALLPGAATAQLAPAALLGPLQSTSPETSIIPAAEGSKVDSPQSTTPPGNPQPAQTAKPLAGNALEDPLKPSFRVRGLIETELAMAAQSSQSKAILGNIQDGYGFRRIRLGAQGTIGDSARWVSEVELAGGNVQPLDVFIGLTSLPGIRELRVGHFREPFSLEGMTGVPFVTFLERSPLNGLDPARNWGVCGYWWTDDERLLFAFGTFRDGTALNGNSVGDQNAWAYTGRLTGLPLYEPDGIEFRLVHLGAAMSVRNPFDRTVVYNPGRVPSLLAVVDNPDTPFLPPVSIPADGQQLYNLQAANVVGPVSFQGEWFGSSIQRTNGGGNIFLHGFYTQASYFLTGEHRGYDRTRGAFSQVKVQRPVSEKAPGSGWGAFELAARYTYYDAASPNLPPSMDGTTSRAVLQQMELGLNWYLNDNTRLMFNYTLPIVNKVGFEQASSNVFSARAAIYW
jgi:phosphate-selective porin OprO/OprP